SLDKLYVSSEEGVVFKPFQQGESYQLPVLTGLVEDISAFSDTAHAPRIREAIALAREYERRVPGGGRVDEIHWSDSVGWTVVSARSDKAGDALRVVLGNQPYEQFQRVSSSLVELDGMGKAAAT